MNITNRYVIFFLLFVLLSSSMVITYVDAQNQKDRGFAWSKSNYDVKQTNYNPQNQITKETLPYLVDEWTNAFIIPPIQTGLELHPGMRARPLIANGLVYMASNFNMVFVHNVGTGLPLWGYAYPINMTKVIEEYPRISTFDSGILEEATIFENNIIFPTPDCGMVFLDLMTGSPGFRGELTRGQMCDSIEGNGGYYTGQLYSSPVVDSESRILVTGTSVSGKAESGRGYIAGFDVDSGDLLWRFYLMPPSGGERDWAMKYKGLGNVDPTSDDWGDAKNVGVGIATGQWAIDEENGIVYVGTSAPGPYYNAANRPGPNLFSSSILALDITTGELLWYYQTSSHDLFGHGCNWNTVLGEVDDRKVLFKACDDGRLLALDASDGELIWSFLPPNIKYVGGVDNSLNPATDLNKKWPTEPSTNAYWQCPGITGATGGNIALAYGKIFYMTTNYCDYVVPEPDSENDLQSFGAYTRTELPKSVRAYQRVQDDIPEEFRKDHVMPKNSTLYAVNIIDGSVEWTFDVDDAHRGGLIASGEMVIFSSLDGSINALDEQTGELVFNKFIGASLGTSPTIASAASGEQFIFQTVGGLPERFGQPVSGVFVASHIRGGPMVPIDSEPLEEIEAEEQAELPLNVVLPVILLIVIVFIIASFGPSRIISIVKK